MVESDELAEIAIESSRTVDIEKFVPKASIDDRFRDTPYYRAPEDKVGQEAFAVIRDAMKKMKMVGIGRVVMARRERVMMLEPFGKGRMGTTLLYPYELRSEDAVLEDRLDLTDDTFRNMARAYSFLMPLQELRSTLASMRLLDLAVGDDGRNRTMLSAFRATTSRNQPSNAKSIFGPSTWIRGLIKPPPGHGVAYLDWEQQEFGIAAALGNDPLMQEAYRTGDPYLAFAKQARAAPPDATKATHKAVRDRFKACVLAVQYGMGAPSLGLRIGQSPIEAQGLLDLHRQTYKNFWKWSDAVSNHAALHGYLLTVFGWPIRAGNRSNDRSLRNFPVQANGAEMLRLACSEGVETGIKICLPVHDAVLIEAPLDVLDAHVGQMQAIMRRASEIVLDGFALRTDAKVVRYPDRYMDERGVAMWEKTVRLLNMSV